MKPKTLLVLLAGALVALASCQSTPNYKATEAAGHVGETATVTDRVDGVEQLGKGNTFLNMGGKHPNQTFTAYIPSGSWAVSAPATIQRANCLCVRKDCLT